MAHVGKYTRTACSGLTKHFERAKDEAGNYIHFRNQDIDLSRSPLNYNLAPDREEGQLAFIRQRLSQVKCLDREDVKVMCGWVVTLPREMLGDEVAERRFFEATYDFLAKKYGVDNVVSAYVHRDEVTPHIHFAFIPVVQDKKKGHLKVSAKEVLTRPALQKFHGELDDHLRAELGDLYRGGVINDATREGNLSVEELKRLSAPERVQQLRRQQQDEYERIINGGREQISEEYQAVKADFEEAYHATLEVQDRLSEVQSELKHLKGEKNALEREIKALRGKALPSIDHTNKVEKRVLPFVDQVVLSAKDFDWMSECTKAYWANTVELDTVRQQVERLTRQVQKYESELPLARTEIGQYTAMIADMRSQIEWVEKVLDSEPELRTAYDRQAAELTRQRQERRRLMEPESEPGHISIARPAERVKQSVIERLAEAKRAVERQRKEGVRGQVKTKDLNIGL